jgi:tRNA G18 (ribose-2'-O)-methylase SpoU
MITEIESLNAAVAGAICMYELMLARTEPARHPRG